MLFFLPDPAAALASWVPLLRPGGRLGVSTFGARDPLWSELDAVFEPYLPPQMIDARTSGERGPFSTDEGMVELFERAGLADVTTEHMVVTAQFDDAEHWERWWWSHGQRAMWEHVPEAERPAVREAALDRAPWDGFSLALDQQVRYTIGVRAGWWHPSGRPVPLDQRAAV